MEAIQKQGGWGEYRLHLEAAKWQNRRWGNVMKPSLLVVASDQCNVD
jgi:hypothetical protein